LKLRLKRIVPEAVLAATLLSIAANAMKIPEYDQMTQTDRRDYSVGLVEGSIKALNAHGQPDQAQKLATLFADKSDKGGFYQLALNLNITRDLNKENAAKPDNKEPIYEVEHAFAVTLKNDSIIVPINVLMAINKDFKPSGQKK
jgi:hypothetical protein